jgi:hypothetical protein
MLKTTVEKHLMFKLKQRFQKPTVAQVQQAIWLRTLIVLPIFGHRADLLSGWGSSNQMSQLIALSNRPRFTQKLVVHPWEVAVALS